MQRTCNLGAGTQYRKFESTRYAPCWPLCFVDSLFVCALLLGVLTAFLCWHLCFAASFVGNVGRTTIKSSSHKGKCCTDSTQYCTDSTLCCTDSCLCCRTVSTVFPTAATTRTELFHPSKPFFLPSFQPLLARTIHTIFAIAETTVPLNASISPACLPITKKTLSPCATLFS